MNDWASFVSQMVTNVKKDADQFIAGRLKEHLEFLQSVTTYPNILRLVTGSEFEIETKPEQATWPECYQFSKSKKRQIWEQLQKMLTKNGVEKNEQHEDLMITPCPLL